MNLRALFAFAVWAGIGYAAVIGLNRLYDASRLVATPSKPKIQNQQTATKASPVNLPNRQPAQR